MISVTHALAEITGLFNALETELVPLAQAGGRTLSETVTAKRDQPPFDASAMDGYATRYTDLSAGKQLTVLGEAAAGARFSGTIGENQAVRIFTGAPIPDGADHVLIQEDCVKDGETITVNKQFEAAHYIRPAGGDFKSGAEMHAPALLGPSEISLLAAMNIAMVPVYRKPVIALVATGDELVSPGQTPNADQIISSNNYGLNALVEQFGGSARILPIAADNAKAVQMVLDMGIEADCIVTLGGASVGDHDLLGQMAQNGQIETNFYKVAMRPGKPLMAGRYQGTPIIGLPGNPVSSLVCAHIFLRPALSKMLGWSGNALPLETAPLGADLGPNGPREHYMRASLTIHDGKTQVSAAERQDSSLLSVFSGSNALIIRPPNKPAIAAGNPVKFIRL